MDHFEPEIKRAKRTNYIIFGFFAGLFLVMILAGVLYHSRHTFTTEKGERNPEERTRIVDDLLSNHELVGMTEAEIISLLGADNNDYGYFNKTERYVYYLGPERGLFSIDSEWLILDFTYGIVTHCYITTD